MIDAEEHFYRDDPKLGHPDVRTRLKECYYFFLGNGRIGAALQIAPSGEGTPLGLIIMDPERLAKKRDALTFAEDSGFEHTMLALHWGRGVFTPQHSGVRARWHSECAVPTVEVSWAASTISVKERFYCDDISEPRLIREIELRNNTASDVTMTLKTAVPLHHYAKTMTLGGTSRDKVYLRYALADGAVTLHETGRVTITESARLYWRGTASCVTDSPLFDHFFAAANAQLPAVFSTSGRMDGSIWQYNLEWVRDLANAAVGLVMSGHVRLARTILSRLLSEFVTERGDTVDSSLKRDRDEVELDQNGVLLYALEQYTRWTPILMC